MRPYIAIIKDSFRAAMASRVLYVLLILIAVLLLVLAPLHMRETLDWKLIMEENVRKPDLMARQLVEKHNQPKEKAMARIWSQLPGELQDKLLKFANPTPVDADAPESADEEATPDDENVEIVIGGQQRRPSQVDEIFAYQELIGELNKQIKDREFYRAEDWEDVRLSEETRELIEVGADDLPEDRLRRLNRLLIARALSPTIDTGKTALEFWYAFWKAEFMTTSMTHQQFAQALTSKLPYYFDKFVLSIGLFIAILVTANMIPETFEPGSLNLLLSKPISRWGLYLSKFIGGCVFIFLCAALLFVGVWLWLGLAMGVWDRAILISIPLYVLVFAIYFSVSALVGLVWRSAIVAVILTLLFWAMCFAAGSVHGVFATRMSNGEIVDLLPVDGDVYSMDLIQQLQKWDQRDHEWDVALSAELRDEEKIQYAVNQWMIPMRTLPAIPGMHDRLHPVYDAAQSRIYASPYIFGQFSSSSNRKMTVTPADDVDFQDVGTFPRDTLKIFLDAQGLVAATSDGKFHRLKLDALDEAIEKTKVKKDDPSGDQDKQPKKPSLMERVGFGKKSDLFAPAGPKKRATIAQPHLVSFNPADNRIAVYRENEITIFALQDDGSYEHQTETRIKTEFDERMSCLIEFKGDTLLLAFGNGQVLALDSRTLEQTNEFHPENRSAIQKMAGSSDGRYFAIQYRNGNLWVLDRQGRDEFELGDFIGQGDVCAFAFGPDGPDGQLWVAENTDRASLYNLADGKRITRYAPGGTWLEKTYRYGIQPLYRIFPKPGEFYKVVTHLSSSGDTENNADIDLRAIPFENANPWIPLWSGLGFMSALLLLACTIFHFKDF